MEMGGFFYGNFMKKAIIRLYYSADTFGKLICWRLESAYSHATIQLGDTIYSATFPKIVAVGTDDKDFGMPPRIGREYTIALTADEYDHAEAWFKAQVGTSYDILSMLGWAFRVQTWQSRKRVYCFESVYACLAAAGVFPVSKLLVTGDQLLVDLYETGRITVGAVGVDNVIRAVKQKIPVMVVK